MFCNELVDEDALDPLYYDQPSNDDDEQFDDERYDDGHFDGERYAA
jgi:hypothetical protein